MGEIIAVLAGVLKFWEEVKWLISTLQGTPADQRARVIIKIQEASRLADDSKGDTSAYEAVIRS